MQSPLANQLDSRHFPEVEQVQREPINPVADLARIEQEGGDHRIHLNPANAHTSHPHGEQIVLDVVPDLGNVGVLHDRAERIEHMGARQQPLPSGPQIGT